MIGGLAGALLSLAGCGSDAEEPPVAATPAPQIAPDPTPSYPQDEEIGGLLPAEPREAMDAIEAATRARARAEAAAAARAKAEAAPPIDPATLPPLSVISAVLAHDVVDRAPVREAATFREGTEVRCFNILGNPGGGQRTVRHVWYADGRRKSSIKLSVKRTRWRTWSSLPVFGPGPWRVDIVDEADRVLESLPFTVER